MVVNPVGPVPLFDSESPRTITVACNVGVTGGQLVFFSGLSNCVSSGADSYVTNELKVAGLASGALFNGIVTTPGNTPSGTNNFVTVAQNGTWITTSAGTILAGQYVIPNGDSAVVAVTLAAGGIGSYMPIAKAVSPAGSEGYTAITLL